ncbi:ankyrin [Peniophora sp. CONT]|nr:ankyrin [Peniophora sp. CONT]
MTEYTPSPAFQDAATYLTSPRAPSNTSTTTKLELYGLFKFLTASPTPTTGRPSFFDMTGRAKWDAWAQAGKEYDGRAGQAEERYLEIARGMGWVPGEAPTPEDKGKGKEVDNGEEDDGESSRGGGTGMGVSVSKMAVEGEEESTSELHRLAVEDDAFELLNFIDGTPGLDVNAKDEFGYTALHLAADRGNAAAVKALLAKGADRSLQDEDEFTALELAKVAGHEDVVALLDK